MLNLKHFHNAACSGQNSKQFRCTNKDNQDTSFSPITSCVRHYVINIKMKGFVSVSKLFENMSP